MPDLSELPVVDTHCHPWRNDDLLRLDPGGFEDRITMMGMCLITSGWASASDDAHTRLLTDTTPLALTMRRRLAARLGCEPTREAVAEARHAALAADPAGYVGGLLADAGIAALVYDEGYPQPPIPREEFAAASGARVHRVARIETAIARLCPESHTFADLEDAFIAEVEAEARAGDVVAFKSVIAYRTGLDVDQPERETCRRAFVEWRRDGFRESREHAKPVRDALFRGALDVTRRFELPFHVHCGGGDPAIALGHARPQDLYALLGERLDQPIVLIHSGWPWVEEAAYVASVLPHVYLDVSLLLPWIGLALDQKLEVILGAAPPAKVLYGSDEASEPEVIWLAAQLGREALGRVLGIGVERGWLDDLEARKIGEGVLAANTCRLHGISLDD